MSAIIIVVKVAKEIRVSLIIDIISDMFFPQKGIVFNSNYTTFVVINHYTPAAGRMAPLYTVYITYVKKGDFMR